MFVKATRAKVAPKIAIQGVSGSGKTYSSLLFARGFVGDSGRIAVIDTENGSASLYSSVTDFDVMEIKPRTFGQGQSLTTSFWFSDFKDAIKEAENQKYDALIIDSASHIWDGAMDFKARLDKTSNNSFINWGQAGAGFKNVQNAILQSPLFIVCCMRCKTEYVIETDETGKAKPKKLGLSPITRGDSEYDYTLVFDLDRSHIARVEKTRCDSFDDNFAEVITSETGKVFKDWFNKF